MPKLWTKTIQEHRAAVHDAAVEATGAIVAADGLGAVTMSRVAEETGIGRATLYKYFPDVEALLLAWHERHVGEHLRELAKIREGDGSSTKKLEAVLLSFASRAREHPDDGLFARLHESEHVAHARTHLTGFLTALIAESAHEGEVRDDVGADELATYCVHALGAAASLPSKAAVRRLVMVTLSALRPMRTEAT